MKFQPDVFQKISVTLVNDRLTMYARPEYDIRIRSKDQITGESKSVTLPDYITDTPKYKASKEAAYMVTAMTIEYLDGRSEFRKVAEKILNVLTREQIQFIYEATIGD